MKARWTMRFTAMALGVLLVSTAWAQPGGPRGMRGMRDNPKRHLERFIMGVGLLEKSGKAKLTSSQAKKIVTLVSPWRSKATMSEAQAKDLNKKLGAVLTSAQTNELKGLRPRRRDGERRGPNGERRNGPRPGGRDSYGGPGGGRRGPGGKEPSEAEKKEFKQRMEKMRSFSKTYNPFYPPTKYQTIKSMPSRMQDGFKRRYDATSALLAQLARKAGKR